MKVEETFFDGIESFGDALHTLFVGGNTGKAARASDSLLCFVWSPRSEPTICSCVLTQSLNYSVTQSLSHSVTQSLSHSVTQSLSHSVTQSLSHSVTQSLTLSVHVHISYTYMCNYTCTHTDTGALPSCSSIPCDAPCDIPFDVPSVGKLAKGIELHRISIFFRCADLFHTSHFGSTRNLLRVKGRDPRGPLRSAPASCEAVKIAGYTCIYI